MSTHLLPALFSCRKHHGICGYVAPILDQKGVRTRGVSYLNIPQYIHPKKNGVKNTHVKHGETQIKQLLGTKTWAEKQIKSETW